VKKTLKLLRNRRGTAEIIGSALFVVIILFFFSNVYLWHDQATREMNNVLLERMNASVSMVATDEGVNVTNNGGVTFALSRLWILDGTVSQHYYADLENITSHRISVVAGQTIQIRLNFTAPPRVTGSPIPVTWDGTLNCPIVQYAPPEYGITLRILTEFGNTASCAVARRPNIVLGATRGPVGTLVTLSGSNFEPASLITVKYDGISVPTSPPQAQTDASGALDVAFYIPASAFGNHTLMVTDNGGSSASTTLDVTPSLAVYPPNGPKHTTFEVSGNGFAASSSVTVTYLGASSALTTSAITTSTGSFTVPPFKLDDPGDYWVTATDANSDSASGTFTVTNQ
jgi:hypothetical protein